ncbi:MAG: nucleotide exchange factor GrpE [bacterium]|nr:nucleotide exchange factor GrpE [bacterium]
MEEAKNNITSSPTKSTTLAQTQSALEKAKKEAQDYLDGWKRAKADYINYKNEQEKRSRELAQFAGLTAVVQVIPVMESFRKAFDQVPVDLKGSDWVAGIDQIYKQLQEGMKNLGVEQVTSLEGQSFDPQQHEAVGTESDTSKEEGVILKEVNAGYTLYGKVVLPAKVVINKIIANS